MKKDKRCFDFAISFFILISCAPIFLLLAALIRIKLGSPVFFRQTRPGLHGRPFQIIKFRTMTDARDAEGNLLSDTERLTQLGRFLRMTSLDELPELWNVLRGDMSLVGPRPLLMEYLPLYTPEQARRHEVRPGITGWAQVNGRQTITFSRRLELDIWYIDHWSIALDIKILFKTIINAFKMTGVISGQDVKDVDDLGLSRSNKHKKDA